jgi:hypothetical protein
VTAVRPKPAAHIAVVNSHGGIAVLHQPADGL